MASRSKQIRFGMVAADAAIHSLTFEDASISEGMLTLDVACGPGYVSASVKQLGAVPTGIDFSDKTVAIARGNVPEHSIHARRRTRPAIR